MKFSKSALPALVSGMGLLACLLRSGLYFFGTDEKGLLVAGHPLEIALWLLTAAAAVLVMLQIRKLGGNHPYAANFPAGIFSGIGCFVFAAGIFLTVVNQLYAYSTLESLRNILCLLAVPALAVVAVCRKLGKRPFFGFHAIICLALTLHTISCYRIWCSHPQLQDAFFPLMGCLLLMLFSYQQTAFDVDMGSRRIQLGAGLLAAFACFAAIPESQTPLLYLTGGIWTLTNLCALTPAAESAKEDIQ